MNISQHLQQARAEIANAFQRFDEDKSSALTYQQIGTLAGVIEDAITLRDAAMMFDYKNGLSLREISRSYRVDEKEAARIVNANASEVISDSTNIKTGGRMMELGTAALIDIRGVRIVETMRQKIAQVMGVTVQGSSIAVRFGEGKSLQQVSMQVVSVIDTEVMES
ncbi:MAG: hypothetical protein ABWX90_03340 [Candidatus Saccharimonadales bacterium]